MPTIHAYLPFWMERRTSGFAAMVKTSKDFMTAQEAEDQACAQGCMLQAVRSSLTRKIALPGIRLLGVPASLLLRALGLVQRRTYQRSKVKRVYAQGLLTGIGLR